MAIAFWEQSGDLSGATGTTDVTPVIPPHATNDILICITANRTITANTCATPSGWTLLYGPEDETDWRSYVFWKRAASSSETNPLCDWLLTGDKYAQVHAIRGCITSGDPFAASAFTHGSADPGVATGVTTTADSQYVIALGLAADNAAKAAVTTATDPAAFQQRHYSVNTTGADAGGFFLDGVRATAGATGSVSVNFDDVPLFWGILVAAMVDQTESPPAIRADASGPGSVWSTGLSATTASFTPAANSLLVAMSLCGNTNETGTRTAPVTDSLSSTWTLVHRLNGSGSGSVEIWAMDAGSSPAARTVTATGTGGSNASGVALTVKVLVGAKPAAQQTLTAQAGSNDRITYVTTTTDSWVMGGMADMSNASPRWALNTVTAEDLFVLDTGQGEKYIHYRARSLTTTPGSTTYGYTDATGNNIIVALVEILAATAAAAPTVVQARRPAQPPARKAVVLLPGATAGGDVQVDAGASAIAHPACDAFPSVASSAEAPAANAHAALDATVSISVAAESAATAHAAEAPATAISFAAGAPAVAHIGLDATVSVSADAGAPAVSHASLDVTASSEGSGNAGLSAQAHAAADATVTITTTAGSSAISHPAADALPAEAIDAGLAANAHASLDATVSTQTEGSANAGSAAIAHSALGASVALTSAFDTTFRGNTAEGGTAGTAVTTGNSGKASGNAWNTVGPSSGNATASYVDSPVRDGSLAYKMYGGSGGGAFTYLLWNALGSPVRTYNRFWFRADNVTSTSYPAWISYTGTASGFLIALTNGTVRISQAVGGQLVAGTVSLTVDTWYQMEIYTEAGIGATVYIRNTSGTLVDTITYSGTAIPDTSTCTSVRYGYINANFNQYFDSIEYSSTRWPSGAGLGAHSHGASGATTDIAATPGAAGFTHAALDCTTRIDTAAEATATAHAALNPSVSTGSFGVAGLAANAHATADVGATSTTGAGSAAPAHTSNPASAGVGYEVGAAATAHTAEAAGSLVGGGAIAAASTHQAYGPTTTQATVTAATAAAMAALDAVASISYAPPAYFDIGGATSGGGLDSGTAQVQSGTGIQDEGTVVGAVVE